MLRGLQMTRCDFTLYIEELGEKTPHQFPIVYSSD
jgi:hypothetical protein